MKPFWQSTFLQVGFGALALGGWAYFVNMPHGPDAALKAALVQASLSAMITLFMKKIIEFVARKTSGLAGYILPPLASFGVSLVTLSVFHNLAGTPEILHTIMVPLLLSSSYAVLYTIGLRSSSR